MLARYLRFKGHGSLRYLYRNAAPYRTRYFVIKAITNPRRKSSRFSVVVSKKVYKGAVGRNRIRRRVYEILRALEPSIEKNHDIAVIITSSEVRTLAHIELQSAISSALHAAKVLH